MERTDIDITRQSRGVERGRDAADLAGAGQEDEHVARLFAQRTQDSDRREPLG